MIYKYRFARNVGTTSFIAPRQYRRSMAIYAIGEGWTGALKRENILKTIPGHFDEDFFRSGNDDISSMSYLPVLIYPNDDIKQAIASWGNSAFLNTDGELKVVGRPHDLESILRLNRMPAFLQRWVNRSHDTSDATPVGRMISNLIGWASETVDDDSTQQNTWKIAEKFSLLDDWTNVSINSNSFGETVVKSDDPIKHISCGPGFMAIISESGTLYSMGVNSRGQCGTGEISNNVWTPQTVRGLTLASLTIGSDDKISNSLTEQDQPIIQVALGFQHGYALSKEGTVYSWGKATRGQLGRFVNADQDACARPIKIDNKNQRVVEIGAGFHHGALLTDDGEVFVWGKYMSRSHNNIERKGSNRSGDSIDASKPERVLGLKKATRISCGSHHTTMLMQDGSVYAIGIASDEPVPILDPVELIPAGVLELPLRQFEAHHDRTTVIDRQGTVYQVHLWKDEMLQDYAYFTPAFIDALTDEGHTIQSIHRGWRHSIIVTS